MLCGYNIAKGRGVKMSKLVIKKLVRSTKVIFPNLCQLILSIIVDTLILLTDEVMLVVVSLKQHCIKTKESMRDG